MTIEIFEAYWQNVSPDLPFPGTKAGNDVTYAGWEKDPFKGIVEVRYRGMRNVGNAKHGIVRTILDDGDASFISEATYYEDEEHGLAFYWN